MSLISFVKIRKCDVNSMKQAIRESLDLIDYSFPKDIKNIVIKPNLCYYWDYSTGQTTDPRFVAALADVVREKTSPNVDVAIVESDASAMKLKYAFKMLGYEKLSRAHGLRLVNLTEDQSDATEIEAGGELFRLRLPQTIRNADLKINVPKVKYTMEPIGITCALKNVFGTNPHPKKFKYHSRLGEAIVALNKLMRFNLCIVEGNIVSGAQPRRLGLVMASVDPVAIDTAAARIAGLNTNTIRYIRLANDEGLGKVHFIPKGEPLEYFKARYPRRDLKKRLMSKCYSIVARTGLGERLGLE